MKKLIFLIYLLPSIFSAQTYYSSETVYFDPKEKEEIERTIEIGKDTITLITKAAGITDIQKLIINYSHEGKMDRIGKAIIYECVAKTGPLLYDIGIQTKEKVKLIGVTAVNVVEKKTKFMIFKIK